MSGLSILYGYLTSIGYLAAIFLAMEIAMRRFSLPVEYSRKVLHVLIGFVWVFFKIFFGATYHILILPSVFVVFNVFSYRFKLLKVMERPSGEQNHAGTIYYALTVLALMVVSYLCPDLYDVCGLCIFCLAFGDGFASLFGSMLRAPRRLGSALSKIDLSVRLVGKKTLGGTLFCFIGVLGSVLAFEQIFSPGISVSAALGIACFAAMTELFSRRGLDNVLLPLAVFGLCLLSLSDWREIYTVSLVSVALIVLMSLLTSSLTERGAFTSWVLLTLIGYFGGAYALALYFVLFLLTAVVSRLGKRGKSVLRTVNSKHGARDGVQVFCNGASAALMCVLYYVSGRFGFIVAMTASLCGCFADSVASDVGVLSRRSACDIVTRKPVSRGLSGGVTVLGTLAALLASLLGSTILFAAPSAFAYSLSTLEIVGAFFFCAAVAFVSTLFDSVLGSTVQVKYRCEKCGQNTEKRVHCGFLTKKVGGKSIITNDSVNFLSSLFSAALALVWLAV